jgi:hypothetical protein
MSPSAKKPAPRTWRPGVRLAVALPDGNMAEIPEDRIRLLLVGGHIPDVTPMTGYRIVVL